MKAAIPELAALEPALAAPRLQRILAVARRVGLVGSVRPVEQTPEMAFLVRSVPIAYPDAKVVHIVRDGRDVVCSLLEKPWLRREQQRTDDAGLPYGSYARFWVEPDRREEFEHASDARRAAWVWRSYVTAARSAGVPLVEIRYEELASDPAVVGNALADALDVAPEPLTPRARSRAPHVGRSLSHRSGRGAARGRRGRGGSAPRRARLRQMSSARDWRTMARCA